MNLVKPFVVYISSIHDIKTIGFEVDNIQNIYIMNKGGWKQKEWFTIKLLCLMDIIPQKIIRKNCAE